MTELPTELIVCLQTIVFGSFHYRAAFSSASDQELGQSTPGANGTGAENVWVKRPVRGQDLGAAALDLEVLGVINFNKYVMAQQGSVRMKNFVV